MLHTPNNTLGDNGTAEERNQCFESIIPMLDHIYEEPERVKIIEKLKKETLQSLQSFMMIFNL